MRIKTDDVPIHGITYWIVKTKKHWWSRWKYVMDDFYKVPKLFHTENEAINAARRIEK